MTLKIQNGHPGGGQTPQILNQNEPKYKYLANSNVLIIHNSNKTHLNNYWYHLMIQIIHKNRFRAMHGSIFSKLIVKQHVFTQYRVIPGGQIPKL